MANLFYGKVRKAIDERNKENIEKQKKFVEFVLHAVESRIAEEIKQNKKNYHCYIEKTKNSLLTLTFGVNSIKVDSDTFDVLKKKISGHPTICNQILFKLGDMFEVKFNTDPDIDGDYELIISWH